MEKSLQALFDRIRYPDLVFAQVSDQRDRGIVRAKELFALRASPEVIFYLHLLFRSQLPLQIINQQICDRFTFHHRIGAIAFS